MPMLLSPVITFAIYLALPSSRKDPANVTKVFTSLSLLVLLSEPLFGLLESIIDLTSAIACFNRIQVFLAKPRRTECRDIKINNDNLEVEKANQDHRGEIVKIHHASFNWSHDDAPVLRDISLTIPAGKLTMIIGPVGCGKSTLLKAMVGELASSDGRVEMFTRSVAWCEQSSWLMVGETIQDGVSSIY